MLLIFIDHLTTSRQERIISPRQIWSTRGVWWTGCRAKGHREKAEENRSEGEETQAVCPWWKTSGRIFTRLEVEQTTKVFIDIILYLGVCTLTFILFVISHSKHATLVLSPSRLLHIRTYGRGVVWCRLSPAPQGILTKPNQYGQGVTGLLTIMLVVKERKE